MRERGQYQLQLMKTRSSSGVGQKINLKFNVETLRIYDDESDEEHTTASSILEQIKVGSNIVPTNVENEIKPSPVADLSSNLKAKLQHFRNISS